MAQELECDGDVTSRDRCMHELFEEQAEQAPARVAVVLGTSH